MISMRYAVRRVKTSNCPNDVIMTSPSARIFSGGFWTTGFRLSHKRAKSIFSKKNPYLNSSNVNLNNIKNKKCFITVKIYQIPSSLRPPPLFQKGGAGWCEIIVKPQIVLGGDLGVCRTNYSILELLNYRKS